MPNLTETIRISFDDGKSFESVIVTQLNDNEYRLDETPLSSETALSFGDVIETEIYANGNLVFRRIISKANFQTYWHLVSRQLLDTQKFKTLCETILQLGGMWELALGGVFIAHIPNDLDFDVSVEIKKISRSVNRTK